MNASNRASSVARSPLWRVTGLLSGFLLLLGGGLVGCDREAPVEIPAARAKAEPSPADSFYTTVGAASIEGEAANVLAQAPELEERTLLDLDFESGSVGILKPFSLERGSVDKLGKVGGLSAEEGSSNHALHIGPGVTGAASFRTPPIPVEEKAAYTLTYSVRTDGVSGPAGKRFRYALVEPLFFAVPSYQHDPATFLTGVERRKRTQLAQEVPRGPDHIGTTTWQTHTLQFTAPATANYMILSFDHTRSKDDKGFGKPSVGDVWFDSIKLISKDRPLQVRYHNPDDLNSSPSPLQLRVELPAEDKGAETRYALFAPTPSTLKFKRKIPAKASLSLAAGMLREGWIPGRGGVDFLVNVIDAAGRRTELMKHSLKPGEKEVDRQWADRVLDLDAWAGQEVTIELSTASGEGKPGALPGAAAVWGDPLLYSRAGKGRLVVLTIIDTVNVAHSSAYGYDRKTTPNLSRIGQMGALFEHAYSAAPWTLPSIASIFTGLDAVRHGAGERAWGEVVWRRPLPERFMTLAERLRAAGFQTTAFVNNPYLTSTFGLGQGFTTYRDYGVGTRTGAGEVGVNHAIDWLKGHHGYDRLLVVHLMDCHGPYRPPVKYAGKFSRWWYWGRFRGQMGGKDYLDLAEGKEPVKDESTRRQIRDLYDGALNYADFQMGRLYDAVQELGDTTDITFAVVADHGEELWEHGGFDHGHQAYNELLRVPFVVENPAVFHGGRRIPAEVRMTDVVPTLLSMVGLPVPEGLNGVSLLPLLKGEKETWPVTRPLFAENELYGSAAAALIEGPYKYLYNMQNTSRPERRPQASSRYELYDLSKDPDEQENRTKAEAARLAALHKEMDSHLRPVLAGRYVVALDGGGQAHTFDGQLQLAGRGGWFNFYEDIVAPLPDGAEGALKVHVQGNMLRFQVRTERAILAFKPVNAASPGGVNLTLAVDGKPWTGGVALGGGGSAGAGETVLRFADTQLSLAPEALPDPVSGGIAVFLGRTSERSLGLEQQKALPAETADRLKALGYIE